eukprot:6716800-Alexandrium_andersonii.AAC.1
MRALTPGLWAREKRWKCQAFDYAGSIEERRAGVACHRLWIQSYCPATLADAGLPHRPSWSECDRRFAAARSEVRKDIARALEVARAQEATVEEREAILTGLLL